METGIGPCVPHFSSFVYEPPERKWPNGQHEFEKPCIRFSGLGMGIGFCMDQCCQSCPHLGPIYRYLHPFLPLYTSSLLPLPFPHLLNCLMCPYLLHWVCCLDPAPLVQCRPSHQCYLFSGCLNLFMPCLQHLRPVY